MGGPAIILAPRGHLQHSRISDVERDTSGDDACQVIIGELVDGRVVVELRASQPLPLKPVAGRAILAEEGRATLQGQIVGGGGLGRLRLLLVYHEKRNDQSDAETEDERRIAATRDGVATRIEDIEQDRHENTDGGQPKAAAPLAPR